MASKCKKTEEMIAEYRDLRVGKWRDRLATVIRLLFVGVLFVVPIVWLFITRSHNHCDVMIPADRTFGVTWTFVGFFLGILAVESEHWQRNAEEKAKKEFMLLHSE
ncbi:MAG: hypothetical protein V1845_02945 [bacterium]